MTEHEEFERLLPWLVNGSLADGERRRLEEHLGSCTACREELERCRGLAEELVRAEPPEPAPHPAQLARLIERIRSGAPEAAEAETEPRAPRPRRLWHATPRAVRYLVAAQAAALVVALGLLATSPGAAGSPGFRTLAAPAAAAPQAAVRVVFAPGATEAAIRGLLLEARAEIVGGPSPLGAYALALGPTSAGETAASVVDLLRADPRVLLAEPIPAPAPDPTSASARDGARP